MDFCGTLVNSTNFEDCKTRVLYKDAIHEYKVLSIQNKKFSKNNEKLEKKGKKLSKDNKELKKDVKKLKDTKDDILNSRSWKYTKILRNIKHKV